ncbi:MAG: SpoIID/LytB domain-containing protein [Actinomycetota bacterium]
MTRLLSAGVAALALLVTAVLVAVAMPAGRAAAAPNDIIAVRIDGIGFGHGRGMSQWGAYGWAVDEGWTWQQILDHYYGGTSLSSVPAGGRIRVRLTDLDGQGTVGFISHNSGVQWNGQSRASMYAVETSEGTFDVYGSDSRACPGATALTVPNGPLSIGSGGDGVRQIQTFLSAYHDNAIAIDGDFGPQTEGKLTAWQQSEGLTADGVWNQNDADRARSIISSDTGQVSWSKLGTASGVLTFATSSGDDSGTSATNVLGLCEPGGSVTHYRGTIDVRSTGDGNRVVNDVKVEDYLRGVVPKEISASWADAGSGRGANAVRAQAVAARSYGLQQDRYSYASTCDTQSCQVYFGAASRPTANGTPRLVEDFRTDQAIAATANQVRTFPNGSIASTEFSASNGPRTAGGVFPPVDDVPGDGTANNPNHRWTRILDADDLAAEYGLGSITGVDMVEAASSSYRGFDGIWFNDVVLTGSNGNTFRQQAWDFRRTHDLRSPGFTVTPIRRDTTTSTVAFIGDSVGSSIATDSSSELRRLTDGTFPSLIVDAVSSRCTTRTSCPGTSGVEAAGALPSGLDLVVVELGYNDSPAEFAGDIDAMMAALAARDVSQVAWVTMAEIRNGPGGSSYYGSANAALQAAAGRHSNLTILDWDQASAGMEQPRWFSDGVHLTATGQAEFALWLREQMLALAPSHRLGPPKILRLPVVGEQLALPGGGTTTVPSDVAAVALNLTIVDAFAQGFATVWPCGVDRPTASNINFPPGVRIANGVIAPVGADGTVCVYSHRTTDIVVDIAGYFSGGDGADFEAAVPLRLVDSRIGTGGRSAQITRDQPLRIPVRGVSVDQPGSGAVTVPDSATAAALTVAVVDPVGQGHVTLHPCGVDKPTASNVNFPPGSRIANGVVAPIGEDGAVCLYAHVPTDVVVDLAGWFEGGEASAFVDTVPTRFVDTRDGTGGRTGRVERDAPLTVEIHGRSTPAGAIPTDAIAVALNLTIVDPLDRGYATVWPCGEQPTASNINFAAGQRIANNVVAPIGPDGSICVYVHNPAHVVLDVSGWFLDSGGFVGATPRRLVDSRIPLGPMPT